MLHSKITIKALAKDEFHLNEISPTEVTVNAVQVKIKMPKVNYLPWVSKLSLQLMEL